jgi:hypothetical protein
MLRCHLHAVHQPPEHHVLAVQPGRGLYTCNIMQTVHTISLLLYTAHSTLTAVVMKNCAPLVSGPLFAMERRPGLQDAMPYHGGPVAPHPSCSSSKLSSLK